METKDKVRILQAKGVKIISPTQVYIDADVLPEQIAAGSCLYPFTRLHGEKTTIATGALIGQEGPATVIDCCIGKNVQLKGGFFSNSLFLEGSSIGSGAHIRECCIIEEEASCAHSVGLKHTILFPFVTLGSLVNFCDCLLAGGTSRTLHSEVGSSYIHFNFTPHQDKATPSLLGDVPRGVMLRESAIFLGGQGGIVGPARLDYGSTLPAGTIWRGESGSRSHIGNPGEFQQGIYKRFRSIAENNINYIANLIALKEWYAQVRSLFWQNDEYGTLFSLSAAEILKRAIAERILRLQGLCAKAMAGRERATHVLDAATLRAQDNFIANFAKVAAYLDAPPLSKANSLQAQKFIATIAEAAPWESYISVIKKLDSTTVKQGSDWLTNIVEEVGKNALTTFCTL